MADGVKSSCERFQVALDWLDCLIEREVLRLRGRYELSLDELRGLYVSDARVDALLRERLAAESDVDPAATLSAHARALHARLVDTAPLGLLRERLALTQAETDVELLVLGRDSLQAMTETAPRAAAAFFYAMVQVFMERLRRSTQQVAEATRWGLEATGLDVEAR